MSRPLVSIVIPVFNELPNLPRLVSRLIPVLESEGVEFEVVFVNDGSIDSTLAALRSLNANDPRLKIVSFSRNFGKEHAIVAGLHYAAGDAVVIMDADLQHPPETLPEFLARWREGFRIVYGQRQSRDADTRLRRTASSLFRVLFRILGIAQLAEGAGDFRLLDRKAVNAFLQLGERARFNNGLYSWIGFNAVGVRYDVAERAQGKSQWSARRLILLAVDGLTSFSTFPLKISSILGLAISLLALAYGAVFLIKTLIFGVEVSGFPSLIVSIMFFSGIQLISLGVLGEYLGRIWEEVKARPLYIVAEEIGFPLKRGSTEDNDPTKNASSMQ